MPGVHRNKNTGTTVPVFPGFLDSSFGLETRNPGGPEQQNTPCFLKLKIIIIRGIPKRIHEPHCVKSCRRAARGGNKLRVRNDN